MTDIEINSIGLAGAIHLITLLLFFKPYILEWLDSIAPENPRVEQGNRNIEELLKSNKELREKLKQLTLSTDSYLNTRVEKDKATDLLKTKLKEADSKAQQLLDSIQDLTAKNNKKNRAIRRLRNELDAYKINQLPEFPKPRNHAKPIKRSRKN